MIDIPDRRLGHPSPLIFHLGAAAAGYQSAVMEAIRANAKAFKWQPELSARAAEIEKLDPLTLCRASLGRLAALNSGLEKWQTHPYIRATIDPPVLWSDGSSRLLDYGACAEARNPQGPPILVIPSLINRAYILDLNEQCSLLRFLASQGLRPLLLDWGTPADAEREFDLNSYVIQRFLPALEVSRSLHDKPVGVLGYCMGGTLAAGVLSQQSTSIGAFATIGSPWNFGAGTGVTEALKAMLPEAKATELIDNMGHVFGMVPTEFFQQLFALLNPMQAAVKFRNFNAMEMESPAARHFVAIEDWLADGIPLVTPTAKDLLLGWNLGNTTGEGDWKLQGKTVDLASLRTPTLNVCGTKDNISQLPVAAAMADEIPNAKLLEIDAGHVGMIVGSKARETVWTPVSQFLKTNL